MRATVVSLISVGAAALFAVYAVRLWPAELSVRVDPALASASAALKTTFQSETRSPIPVSGELRVPLVSHAAYVVDLPLSSGEHLWTQYIHTDAGDRRRVDVHFSPSATPNSCHVRIMANKWFFPRREVLWEADVRASDTSEEHPEGVL